MSSIFLDYLDYKTTNQNRGKEDIKLLFSQKHQRLICDILAHPDSVFFVAAPSVAKCKETALLLISCSDLWRNSRIKYILSPNYSGNFNKYIEARLAKLERNFSENELENHFEYKGYTSNHWPIFFNEFLNNFNHVTPFVSREKDCDNEFRCQVKKDVVNDVYVSRFPINSNQDVDKIILSIEEMANDRTFLFQRESIVKKISELGELGWASKSEITFVLDQAFSSANASAVNAFPSHHFPGLDGNSLFLLSKKIFLNKNFPLSEFINRLSLDEAEELSRQKPWVDFISIVNQEIKKLQIILKHTKKEVIQKISKEISVANSHNRNTSFLSIIIALLLSYVFPLAGRHERLVSSACTNLSSYMSSNFVKFISDNLIVATVDLVSFLNKYYLLRPLYFKDFHSGLIYYHQRNITI